MLFTFSLIQALAATNTAQAVAVAPRQATGPDFKCRDGYTLTSYTSAGLATCTKISGTSAMPGYSGQTVAVVGLIAGLTGLITTYLPIGRFFYQSATGYFRQGRQPTWESAFPRALIERNSSVQAYQGDVIHQSWQEHFQQLQSDNYDHNATFYIDGTDNSTAAYIYHQGYNIVHNAEVVPHNETHQTLLLSSDVTVPGDKLSKRSGDWTGARLTFHPYLVNGEYNKHPISTADAHFIASNEILKYLDGISMQHIGGYCCYFGGVHVNADSKPFAATLSITSQVDFGAYPASVCPSFYQNAFDPKDEL